MSPDYTPNPPTDIDEGKRSSGRERKHESNGGRFACVPKNGSTSTATLPNATVTTRRPQGSPPSSAKRRRLGAGSNTPHLSTRNGPAASSSSPVARNISSTSRGSPVVLKSASVTTVKDEPAETTIPPLQEQSVTNHGSFRVKSLPRPGDDRMAWAQAQFASFKNSAEVPIRLARKPIFLPDGLVIDWTSEVPVVLDDQFIPRIPPRSLPSEPNLSNRRTPSASLRPSLVTPPTPQSLHSPPQDRVSETPSIQTIAPSHMTPTSLSGRKSRASSPAPLSSTPLVSSHVNHIPVRPAYIPRQVNPTRNDYPTPSLFAMHRQKHALAQTSAASNSTTPEAQATREQSTIESSPSVAAAETATQSEAVTDPPPGVPEVDSDDDLYMSHEEYERLSKSVEPSWGASQCAKLEQDAVQWLKEFIHHFDTERARLASAYSQSATFSVRALSNPPPRPARVPLHIGPLDIVSSLLDLPESFAFNLIDAGSKLHYDLVVTFDVVVYGSYGEATPLVMLACYADPAHGPPEEEWRWVCEMAFVLRSRTWDEQDRSTEGICGLVALSHHMTLRKIPASMPWSWSPKTL